MRKTTLKKWVETQGGPIPLAKTLNMTPHGIRRWLRGEGTPTVRMTLELIKLSKGELSFHGIIEDIVGARHERK